MWGGTGHILNGNATNRHISSRDDPDGLGRWTLALLRGAEGKVIRSVNTYCPCTNKGLETVYAQQMNYSNLIGKTMDPIDYFRE